MRILASVTSLFAVGWAHCYDINDGAEDSFGDMCDWYNSYDDSCGLFDDDDFFAYTMCCACNGGRDQDYPEPDMICHDIDTGTDISGDGCAWYTEFGGCGLFNDVDFVSQRDCCACGGGVSDLANGASDTTWDTCDWYMSWPEGCGLYDDVDFHAFDLCFACGGGYRWDDTCYDTDFGATDTTGDTCEWYTQFPDGCGLFDDNDFSSFDMCCGCQVSTGYVNLVSHDYDICFNTNDGATDTTGDDCDSWYVAFPDSCGEYDDDDFKAADMCCVCGGGAEHECHNSAGLATDTTYDDCSWYDEYPYSCGLYDDDDFTASQMCCACNGGCHGTSFGAVDWWGDACSYYVDYPQDCGLYDDEDFDSFKDCCACGGGYNCEGVPGGLGGLVLTEVNDRFNTCAYYNAHDSGDDGCPWYEFEDRVSYCGDFDDEDFTASEMCWVCGGGSTSGECYDWGRDARDSAGKACSYYADWPEDCGVFDDEDFHAVLDCCECGGGNRQGYYCIDYDAFSTDFGGDTCAWYWGREGECGMWDDDDFTAAYDCCACSGGTGGERDPHSVDVLVLAAQHEETRGGYEMYGAAILAFIAVIGYSKYVSSKKEDALKNSQINEALIDEYVRI